MADGRRAGRRTAYACLACTLVAGVVVLLEAVATDLPGPARPAAFWASYAALLAVQPIATGLVPAPPLVPRRLWLPAMVAVALGTFLLYPEHGLTAALLVVSAATVARSGSVRAVVGVIAAQSAAAVSVVALLGWPVVDVLAGAVVFPGFQAFGALVVHAARRESEARHELARTHAELRGAVVLLQAASRDAERIRIARDLHDVVGHQLTALALELEVASHLVGDGRGREHVVRARSVAKGLLDDVRTAVAQIRQGPDDLRAMLADLVRDVAGLEVRVHVDTALRIEGEQARALLRCTQEAITNTLRHADAGRLDVTVRADGAGVRLSAVDDGRGTADVVAGHGLTGMRERLEALGGGLCVTSAPGAGFALEGRLPLPEPS